jgi:pyrroloquinoline quinone biosynthesis protein B
VPQWNCGCENCAAARDGGGVEPRTQSSVAVTADGERWLLLNASPDLRGQLAACRDLQPRGIRAAPVAAVLLTDAEVDHTAGLLLLREGGELSLHCTAFVRRALEGSGVAGTLAAYLTVRWTEIVPGRPLHPTGVDGSGLGLEVEPFAVAGDAPLYVLNGDRPREPGVHPENAGAGAGALPGPEDAARGGVVIGVRVRGTGSDAALVYVPGAGAVDPALPGRVGPRDVLLWDGTFWEDDELVRLGISRRRAREMGHLPLAGPGGALQALAGLRPARKALVHVNNTNPVLRRGSPERAAAEGAGWEIARDGSEYVV